MGRLMQEDQGSIEAWDKINKQSLYWQPFKAVSQVDSNSSRIARHLLDI